MRLLESRALPEGGFPARGGEPFRSDATAWAILSLLSSHDHHLLVGSARTRLVEAQAGDGSVSIARDHTDAYWPTALSVLAWNSSPIHEPHCHRGVQFLLETTGRHWKKKPDDPTQHDPSIPGWSWIAGTHSWVEPTALAVCALRNSGLAHHQRVSDGISLLMDRQLQKGGWNVGNIKSFGTELHPNPESTGAALQALAGLVAYEEVRKSLDYLQGEVGRLRTPISLGWGLLGLAAWDRWPSNGAALVERCLANQTRYGEYDTSALCLLLLAASEGEAGVKNTLFPRVTRQLPEVRHQESVKKLL
jgi:hypothetical protein